jgi:hypothetical protein
MSHYSTPNVTVDNVSTILAHFGYSDKLVSKKLWVTEGTVKRWRSDKRVPPHVIIRWKRETGPAQRRGTGSLRRR